MLTKFREIVTAFLQRTSNDILHKFYLPHGWFLTVMWNFKGTKLNFNQSHRIKHHYSAYAASLPSLEKWSPLLWKQYLYIKFILNLKRIFNISNVRYLQYLTLPYYVISMKIVTLKIRISITWNFFYKNFKPNNVEFYKNNVFTELLRGFNFFSAY